MDRAGWRCHRCGIGGTALDLVTLGLYGLKFQQLNLEQRAGLQEWGSRLGWCQPPRVRPTVRPVLRKVEPAPPLVIDPPRPELDPDELAAWWAECGPVTADTEACGYLEGRNIDPQRVADLDLARIVPADGGSLARLCRCRGRGWQETGYRLAVPFVGAGGHLRAIQGGRVRPVPEGFPKAASLRGARFAGMVAADPLGRHLLEHGTAPDWWPPDERLFVVIAEGLPDFLTAATVNGDTALCAPAVLGVIAGSWPDAPAGDALAARIPRGATVVIQTDADPAGDGYAGKIAATLHRRGGLSVLRGKRETRPE